MLIQGLVPLWGRLVDAALSNDDDDNATFCMSVCALNFCAANTFFPKFNIFFMQTCISCIMGVCEILTKTPEVFPVIEPTLLPLVSNNTQSIFMPASLLTCLCATVADCAVIEPRQLRKPRRWHQHFEVFAALQPCDYARPVELVRAAHSSVSNHSQ